VFSVTFRNKAGVCADEAAPLAAAPDEVWPEPALVDESALAIFLDVHHDGLSEWHRWLDFRSAARR
jgi:hypothetical protein